MTIAIAIALLIFIISVSGFIALFLPKISIVSSIDIESIPHERNALAKDRILYSRLRRRVKEWESFLLFVLHPIADFFRQFFHAVHHAYKRLCDAREFQKRQWFKAQLTEPKDTTDSDEYQKILVDAKEYLAKEKYDDAELKCIDLISRNKNCLVSYNLLVSIYSAKKEWEKARDVSDYLGKVYRSLLKNPDEDNRAALECDAAHTAAQLSDIFLALGEKEHAFQSIRRALALQPSNPKYLDSSLEIAIIVHQRLKAEKYLEQLRKANPENNKIIEFEERIKQLKYY